MADAAKADSKVQSVHEYRVNVGNNTLVTVRGDVIEFSEGSVTIYRDKVIVFNAASYSYIELVAPKVEE